MTAIAVDAQPVARPDVPLPRFLVPPCVDPYAPQLAVGRALVLQVRDPGGSVVARTATTCVSERQHMITFEAPPATGEYRVEALNLAPGQAIDVDVSAGLPPSDALLPLPDLSQYVPLQAPQQAATPGLPFAFVVAVLLTWAFARRRA